VREAQRIPRHPTPTLLDGESEWQAEGQLRRMRAGMLQKAGAEPGYARGTAHTWASKTAASSTLRWSCCGPTSGRPQQLQLRPPYASSHAARPSERQTEHCQRLMLGHPAPEKPAALRTAASNPCAPSAAPCARAARPAAEVWVLRSGTSRRRRCRGQIGTHSTTGRRSSGSTSPQAMMGPDGPASAAWSRSNAPRIPARGSPVWRC
jgi:hypothetical protein